MRGFLQPAVKQTPNEDQAVFGGLSRSRRTKVAKAANTSLLKADQWGRGDSVATDVREALETAFAASKNKKKK